jgi:hypothetical protein
MLYHRLMRIAFRVVIVVTWVQVLVAILLSYRSIPKPILEVSYWWLRVIAALAVPVLLYDVRHVSPKRALKMGFLIDVVLVMPMYLLWLLIWLFSSAPI